MAERRDYSLLLTGDSMITRRNSTRRDEASRKLRELIRAADVAFTNLEVVPNDFAGHPSSQAGGTHLAARSYVVDDLRDMGFDIVAAATNHALDYHIEGLLATLRVLENKGLAYAGIGRNLAEARMPVYLDHRAGTLALLSCTSTFAPGQEAADQRPDMQGRPGVNPLRFEQIYEITADQLATLRTIADGLGLERQRLARLQLGFGFPPDSSDIFPFLNTNFRAAEEFAVRTTPRSRDMEAIAGWVREARARADTVVVSLHAHEQGVDREHPADFIRTFTHRMIDEGADLIVGHGSHLLRGMEIYRGKPIFYSLGNFIAQNDLVEKLPSDAYSRYRVNPAATPSEVFSARSQNETRGFPADRRFWETVVPICRFVDNRLDEIELVPVVLGHGTPVHHRGRPQLADEHAAQSILERFAALSEPYGTRIDADGERALVRLDE